MARKPRVTQYAQGYGDAAKISLLVLKLTVDAHPRPLSDAVIEQLGEDAGRLCRDCYDELERFTRRLDEEKLTEKRRGRKPRLEVHNAAT